MKILTNKIYKKVSSGLLNIPITYKNILVWNKNSFPLECYYGNSLLFILFSGEEKRFENILPEDKSKEQFSELVFKSSDIFDFILTQYGD